MRVDRLPGAKVFAPILWVVLAGGLTAFVKAKEPRAGDLDSVIGQSLQEYLVDMLADLRHLAQHRGLDFDQADRLADGHFHAEVGEDS